MDDKVRENRLRRQANRQGMRLVKNPVAVTRTPWTFSSTHSLSTEADSCIVMDRIVFTLSTSG